MGMNFFTFMGNSVAVKLDHHRFFITPQRLEQEFGIMGMNLVTFMSNSVAVNWKSELLHDAPKTGTGVEHHGDEPGHVHGQSRCG